MAFGVDLGTTNSSIAWTNAGGEVYSLRVRHGLKEPFDAVERSRVFDPLGPAPVVGEGAVAAAGAEGGYVVGSFKRRFDKQRLRETRYRVVTTPTSQYDAVNETIRLTETRERVPLDYDVYTLEEVVAAGAAMFGRLLSSAEIDDPGAGGPAKVEDAMQAENELLYVGVPVSFGPTARRRMLWALGRSGAFGTGPNAYRTAIGRCRIVYEPLALAATLPPVEESERVLVFDYGGGTLDVALLDVSPGASVSNVVSELALGGLVRAGDALDATFREKLIATRPRLANLYENQIAGGSLEDRRRADGAFSFAKVRLSTQDEAVVPLFEEVVSRVEFESAVKDDVEAAVKTTTGVLAEAGFAARDIDRVLLTGGSSLIPCVQERLRGLFDHLDELAFVAGTPGDVDSEREALTGVSRGLARFGFLEGFEATAPGNFSVSVPGVEGTVLCLPRGSVDISDLAESPTAHVKVGTSRPVSVALYSDLVKEAYSGGLVDLELPDHLSEVEIRVSASRGRFVPAFALYRPGTLNELAAFDLERMTAEALRGFVEGDCEWLPNHSEHVKSAVLVRPLAVGDFVEWRTTRGFLRGKVIRIREVETNEFVAAMDGFNPSAYVTTVAREENGAILLSRLTETVWRAGDVRLL